MLRVRRTNPEPRLEMTPLVAVVFLLLTFFVVAVSTMSSVRVLDVELPGLSRSGPGEGTEAPITVAVLEDGSLAVEGDPVELAGLVAELRRRRSESPARGLVLAADERSPSGRLLEVVDALSGAGMTDFGLLSRPRTSGPGSAP